MTLMQELLAAKAAIFVAIALAAAVWPSPNTYQLLGTYKPSGEVHIVDHGLTSADCFSAAKRNNSIWGTDVRFTCKRVGRPN